MQEAPMIQIRPAAVQKQINEKKSSMQSLGEECERLQKAARAFTEDESLQGQGWEAAKERIGAYDKLTSAIIYACGLISMGDDTVFNALNSRFGSLEAANEEEWLQMQSEAQALYDAAEKDFNDAYDSNNASADNAATLQDASERMGTNKEKLDKAGAMLSKIYSYCEETNHVYEGDELSDYRNAIAHGVSALTESTFDTNTNTWHDWDDGWTDEMNHAVENTQPSDPMNEDGTVNTQSTERDVNIMHSFPKDSQQYQEAKRRLEEALEKVMAMDPEARKAALAALAQSGLVIGSRDENGYLKPQCSDELGTILDSTGVSWDVLLAAAGYDESDEGSDMSNGFTAAGAYVGGEQGVLEYLADKAPELCSKVLPQEFKSAGYTIAAVFVVGDACLTTTDEYEDDFWLDERSRRIEAATEGIERVGIDAPGVGLSIGLGIAGTGLTPGIGTLIGAGAGLIYGTAMSLGGSNAIHKNTSGSVRDLVTKRYDQPKYRRAYAY